MADRLQLATLYSRHIKRLDRGSRDWIGARGVTGLVGGLQAGQSIGPGVERAS